MFSFVHTDFYNYYLSKASLKGSKLDNKKILKMMIEEIKKISNNKLVIPTYNYDFPKTKRFNFKKDKSQVGTFSDYFWKKFSNFRTGVPIFSTCNNLKINFYKNLDFVDPFGKESEFEFLYKNNGKIINFGSSFAPTYIMYIERSHNQNNGALYRYVKYFEGKTMFKNKFQKTILYYEVRPIKFKIEYDLIKIRNLLIKNKILKIKKNKENFKYEEINAKNFKDLILSKMNNDPYYLLSKETISRLKYKKLYNFKKFKLQQFEK